MTAPPVVRDNPFTRSIPGLIGMVFLGLMVLACVATLPWTLGAAGQPGASGTGSESTTASLSTVPRYNEGDPRAGRLPPFWWPADEEQAARLEALTAASPDGKTTPRYLLGTDVLGRSLMIRSLTGGGISLGIGIAAAFISVIIGTLYGGLAGYIGGKTDAFLMRVVDVLYGLPYILLVVLLAVASEAMIEKQITREGARSRWINQTVEQLSSQIDGESPKTLGDWLLNPVEVGGAVLVAVERKLDTEAVEPVKAREYLATVIGVGATGQEVLNACALAVKPPRELKDSTRLLLDVGTLLLAIGGVSWLTMARVIRGQVLSLKNQQFVEAARATGASSARVFVRHLLPNLLGPIIVYATLTVPQAILQESFLSFLGIGVKPPLPSWGNLAAEGLGELNTYRSNWWLLFFPCLLLGLTLLALNFVGEGLREAFDPKRARR